MMRIQREIRLIWTILLSVLMILCCVQVVSADTCTHENSRYISDSKIVLDQAESWRPNEDGETHSAYGTVISEYLCVDCGEYFDKPRASGLIKEEHDIYSGRCLACGYGCNHENADILNDVYALKDGEEWKLNSDGGKHTALCLQYDRYFCRDCGLSWYEDVIEKIFEERHSGYGSKCNVCGYECTHAQTVFDTYELDNGEVWKPDSSGKTHSANGKEYEYHWCEVCDRSWTENVVEKVLQQGHVWGSDSDCYDCGYVCRHE